MTLNNIDYINLVEQAKYFIVKECLKVAIGNNLLGNHHFFISFLTNFPGTNLSERLLNKYPKEMTIVLQHQYENLFVGEDFFSVDLSFHNIKENIKIPFKALTNFADPSTEFGLKFNNIIDQKSRSLDQDSFPKKERENLDKQDYKDKNYNATNVINLSNFRKK